MIHGNGELYWARSMALAEERAMALAPDYLLWLNDDVVLHRRALSTLFAAEDQSAVTESSSVQWSIPRPAFQPMAGWTGSIGIR